MPKDKKSISEELKALEDIVEWFSSQDEVDVEEGLKKVRTGAMLIRDLKTKLAKAQNEFSEIKKDLASLE